MQGPLRVGARFDLELSLPDGPLRTAAEVVSVSGEGLLQSGAVRFDALAPDNVRRLRALTRAARPRAWPCAPAPRPLARLALVRAAR